MTEPKFRIGDVVHAPNVIGKPCYTVLARIWDTTAGTWVYLGPHSYQNLFVHDEGQLVGPGDTVGAVKQALDKWHDYVPVEPDVLLRGDDPVR